MEHSLVDINALPEDKRKECEDLLKDNSEVTRAMTEFFGEEFTDYRIVDVSQSYDREPVYKLRCIIWYPEITITNEENQSITIKDLYVYFDISKQVPISYIYMRRGTMTDVEVSHQYIHSHSPRLCLDRQDKVINSDHCCLGTSPLVGTFSRLVYDRKDLDIWKLLFMEIDRYAHTESLRGGPYVKLSHVNGKGSFMPVDGYIRQYITDGCFIPRSHTIFKEFLKDYLNIDGPYSNNLDFSWVEDGYNLAMSYDNYVLDISNKFIKWRNDHIKKYDKEDLDYILEKGYTIINGRLHGKDDCERSSSVDTYDGAHVGYFKGKKITLKVVKSTTEDNSITLIKRDFATYALSIILCTINMYYE